MAKSVSVVIPTANRPHYLMTSLRSVERQTAASEIGEVIVSENLGNRQSEKVCALFPTLPIKYVFRDPQLTNEGHIHDLFLEAECEYVALLCDDDWWSPGHLHSALSALRLHPEASAFFAAILLIGAEAETDEIRIWRHPVFPLGVRRNDFTTLWKLSLEEILRVCWIVTPFGFMTMVARREALRSAASYMLDSHPYYADRILYPGLAACGDILYDPLVDTFAREHAGNWAKDKKKLEIDNAFKIGSEKILGLANQFGFNPVESWKEILSSGLPEESKRDIEFQFRYALGSEGMQKFNIETFFIQETSEQEVLPHQKSLSIRAKLSRILIHAGYILNNT